MGEVIRQSENIMGQNPTPQGSGTKVYKKNIEKNALLTHSLCIVQNQ